MAKLYAKSPSGEDALLSISITGFTQSLQQNGWCKLPNGLLLQWRRSIANFIIPLPITFNTIYSIAGILVKQYDNFYERGLRSISNSSLTQYYNDGNEFVAYILTGI